MNRIYYLLCGILTIVCLSACNDEEIVSAIEGTVYDEEVTALLPISHQPADNVQVTTRATLGEVPESRVLNMFVYIFVNGKRIYSHYFDKDNMKASTDEVTQSSYENCWYMRNTTTAGKPSQGTAKICIPKFEGGTLYIISNIDADMVNISPERLNLIQTEDEMKALTASLNQETVSRNGYFPMVAVAEDIKVGNDNQIVYEDNTSETVTALLERMDAKIQVYVRAAAGEKSTTGEETTTVKEFVPESWRVVHIPKGAYVVPRPIAVETDYATADYNEAGYFSTTTTHFETSEEDTKYNTNKHGFSFYMLENREYRKNSVEGDYHSRDLRIKNSDGSYNTENGLWQNAPEQGTYLEIKGDVVMEVDVSSQAGKQQLTANVTYYIHLGDLTAGMDNYNIERNTTYTYTITIHGADKIELEVATSQPDSEKEFTEDESGATGMVYISREYTYTFDAHYGQRVFCFDAEYIEPDQVTWYVKTPFGNEGIPPKVNGVEIPAGYDYKWVEFMLNPLEDGIYSQLNQAYPGYKNRTGGEEGLNVGDTGHLMDVVEFTEWIKNETLKFRRGENSAFVKEEDAEWKEKFPEEPEKYMRHRLYATLFVNEYYYEEHPITGVKDNLLWKQFVNQPNRLMHILCDSRHSLDGESSYTGSIITIRQRSIQTPYNINKGTLQSGWGCETVDETRDMNLDFYENDTDYYNTDFGNDARNNGLYNTACLWNLITLTGYNGSKTPTGYNSSEYWSNYLDYARENDHNIIFMKEDLDCHRYSAMMRNRDNNGNGTIDPEEVRWYIASLQQLYGLYIGGLGLSDEAQLYPRSIATQPNESSNDKWKWRNHIVCSTQTSITTSTQRQSEYFPDYLWAEEGVSVAGYRQEWKKQALMSIRCVRNLGLDNPTTENIWDKTQNIPTDLISFEEEEDGKVYRFNLSNVNEKSLRDYSTTKELEPYDENNETSRPYHGFITSDAFIEGYGRNYGTIKTNLESGGSYGTDGYRLPNVREAALMSLYCSSEWWDGKTILTSSYYSHGSYGTNFDAGTTSWYFNLNHVTLSPDNSDQFRLRLVKDYMPTE